ncbi:hypothetical protein [Bradyrhizobium sp. Tv2a-2]|uniref:hypothetical protein n=1 Tax=Bradyrhizobium sp. Tv2a-2 TaxID=113395 RepID=UPI0012EB2D66|nr:hypothetical protein [Bradyrhizobium sp. Tv2a-2]
MVRPTLRAALTSTLSGSLAVVPLPLTTSNHQQLDQVGIQLQDQIKIDHWIALRGVREDLATSRTDSLSYATGVTTVATKSDEAATRRGAVTTTSSVLRG